MKVKLLKKVRNKVCLRINRMTKEYEVIEWNSYADAGHTVHHVNEEYKVALAHYYLVILIVARKKYWASMGKYKYLK